MDGLTILLCVIVDSGLIGFIQNNQQMWAFIALICFQSIAVISAHAHLCCCKRSQINSSVKTYSTFPVADETEGQTLP